MAGVKGRSGRKSKYTELQEGKLEALAANYIHDNFERLEPKTRLKVALQIFLKSMPTTQNVNSKVEVTQAQRNELLRMIRADAASIN